MVPLEELQWETLPDRDRRLDFVDHPSGEQLEVEWQLRQAQQKLELDAEEAAAFKLKEELDARGVDESVDVAETAAFHARLAELEAAQEKDEADGIEVEKDEAAGNEVREDVRGPQNETVHDSGAEGSAEGSGKHKGVVGEGDEETVPVADESNEASTKSLAQVRTFVLTKEEVQYKLANIEQVRSGVQRSKILAAQR